MASTAASIVVPQEDGRGDRILDRTQRAAGLSEALGAQRELHARDQRGVRGDCVGRIVVREGEPAVGGRERGARQDLPSAGSHASAQPPPSVVLGEPVRGASEDMDRPSYFQADQGGQGVDGDRGLGPGRGRGAVTPEADGGNGPRVRAVERGRHAVHRPRAVLHRIGQDTVIRGCREQSGCQSEPEGARRVHADQRVCRADHAAGLIRPEDHRVSRYDVQIVPRRRHALELPGEKRRASPGAVAGVDRLALLGEQPRLADEKLVGPQDHDGAQDRDHEKLDDGEAPTSRARVTRALPAHQLGSAR